jgi:hypothetical protein
MRGSAATDPPAANGKAVRLRQLPFVQRLPRMSDERLRSLRLVAMEISEDAEHPRQGRAATALPQIDGEIARRAASLANVPPAGSPHRSRQND